MEKSSAGVFGMGVMGQSLALNMVRHGRRVSVYNKDRENTQALLERTDSGAERIVPCWDIRSFCASLETPRRIVLMVTAGTAVDAVLEQLVPLLSPGDIVADAGNSHFRDTRRREKQMSGQGFHFIGMGVSGGEKGALEGPSMMPGGDREAYGLLADLFADIAAKTPDGAPCCDYVGPDGAGHYVKMVHNGIEYADIQLICECYQLMRRTGGMEPEEIGAVFAQWNRGRLNSYLVEITAKILQTRDPETGRPMVDVILDAAEQKGTGKWTAIEALDAGVAAPAITASVFARFLSAGRDARRRMAARFSWKPEAAPADRGALAEALEQAMYASKICCYAQGFALLREASRQYGWELDLGRIAQLWRAGCIIRAGFLDEIARAYRQEPRLENLMEAEAFASGLHESQAAWRKTAVLALSSGTAAPVLTGTLAYFDQCREADCPASLLQAQRDYFGAHTYRRRDRDGVFHTIWE